MYYLFSLSIGVALCGNGRSGISSFGHLDIDDGSCHDTVQHLPKRGTGKPTVWTGNSLGACNKRLDSAEYSFHDSLQERYRMERNSIQVSSQASR